MESQAATPSSLSGESCTLDLPTVCYPSYEASQRASQGSDSSSWSSLESHPFPSSSTSDPDSSSLNTEQKASLDSENFWLDPSKGQLETNEEEDGFRKFLDRFYEAFAHPPPDSGDPLSASVCQCLSQTISELEGQESQRYALRSFQMARVILNRDGCSILQQHSRETRFYPLKQEGSSVDDEEPTPGLSREVIRFLLEQTIMKDS